MEDILKEIKNVPAVMGSYIHVTGITAVHSDLPKIFQNKVYDVGVAVDRIIKINEATNMQANNIEFKYEEASIIVRPIDSDASLITFCETGVNKKTLNMTTGMLSGELKEAAEKIRKGATSSTSTPEITSASEPPPAEQAVDINQLIHAGPLAKIFQDLQNAFAMAIGPIGEMVLKDTVEEWAKKGDCSAERVAELVEMLCREIDDDALEAEFKAAVSEHI